MANSINRSGNLKWLKIIIGGVITFIVLLIALVAGIILFVDPNHYKPVVISVIEDSTGAKLDVGKIHWGFTPELSLVAENIVFDSQTGITKTLLLKLAKADCSLELMPLLHGNIAINKLTLEGLNINLVTNGVKNNWTLAAKTATNGSIEPQTNYQVQLSSLKISRSNISYTDLAKHDQFSLNNLNITFEDNDKGPISFLTNANILSLNNISYSINDIVNGKIDFNYSPNNFTGSITTNKFVVNNLLASLGIAKKKMFIPAPWQNFGFSLNFNGTPNTLVINNTNVFLGKSIINIALNIANFTPLSATNQITIDKIELADFVPLSGYQLLLSNVNMKGSLAKSKSNSLNAHQDLNVGNLTLYGYNLHSLSLKIATILSNPLKIISIPVTIDQIKSSLNAANTSGPKNLNLVSNLGHLTSSSMDYQNGVLVTPRISLNGPDLRVNANGKVDTNRNYLDYRLNAQFVADPTTLTGKIVYPVTMVGALNNPNTEVNWNSVNSQIAANLGSTITNTGKSVGKATDSTLNKIGKTIKGWF